MNQELRIKNPKIIAATMAIILMLVIIVLIFLPFKIRKNEFEVMAGLNLSSIASGLKKEGIIKSRLLFIIYISALDKDEELKAGRYNFSEKISMHDVARTLLGGFAEHDDVQVTIPEGLNVWEMDKIFSKSGLTATGVFAKVAIGHEGKLFPDTYRFKKDADIQEIIARMIGNFKSKALKVTENELIIASILEKEAKTKEDMETVSGVIKNRLAVPAGMPLQIDATVTYGACLREFNRTGKLCDVTFIGPAIEVKIDGPYNTYTRMGLSPGPISNPGLKAIEAAKSPRETDYLYYLSTRDGSQIIYSKTAAEHLVNRKKFLGF